VFASVLSSFAIHRVAQPAAWEQLLVACMLGATLLIVGNLGRQGVASTATTQAP
jgi:hypothetical protein